MKFLEDDTPMETVNNGPTANEQDGDDEDLVRRKEIFLATCYSSCLFILV